MKKSIITFVLALFVAFNTYGQSQVSQDEVLKNSKNLGLMAYLTTVKSVSEAQMIRLASSPEFTTQPDKAKEFMAEYNLLKLSVDQLINQLSADLYLTNRPSRYKNINMYIIKGEEYDLPEKLLPYKPLIGEIDTNFLKFSTNYYGSMLAVPGLTEIIGVIGLVNTVATGARDFREKKVQSLTGLMKTVKLTPIADLIKEKKPTPPIVTASGN